MHVEFEDLPLVRTYSLDWDGNKSEDKFLEPVDRLQSWNGFAVQADDVPIEVGKDSRKNHKGGILQGDREDKLVSTLPDFTRS